MMREELEQQLRNEIADHRQALTELPVNDSFINRLARGQTEARIAEVETDLRDLLEPGLEMVLSGEEADSHRIPANLFARLVGHLERSLVRTGWALSSGATDERQPPVGIERAMALDIVALDAASFHISMRKSMVENLADGRLDLDDESLVEQSVDILLTIFEHAERHTLDEETEDLARRIGGGSARQIQKLMGDLQDSGMDCGFKWASGGSERVVTLTPSSAGYLRDWMRSVEESTDHIRVTGILHGGDDLVGKFKLVDAAENVYEGTASPEVIAGKRFGDTYIANIDVVTAVAGNVGSERQRYILRSLERPPSDPDD